MEIPIKVLPHGMGLNLPSFQTAGSSGVDLVAAVEGPTTIDKGSIALIPTGFSVQIPIGWEFQVRPRSGLALKHGIAVLNSPGTIDADYRGEIQIILANLGSQAFTINRGDRIAQMVLCQVQQFQWKIASELEETSRGSGGFGHTGYRPA